MKCCTNISLFLQKMQFTDDPDQLKEWMPLMMEGRTITEPLAATKIDDGTDVNFGANPPFV